MQTLRHEGLGDQSLLDGVLDGAASNPTVRRDAESLEKFM
tara:strand:- start:1878 stop:1997 length:120 start_codon:yes stop_codon:yes gene_type:complete